MPIIKSAKKALRQSLRRNKRNAFKKKVMKDAVKKIKKLIVAGKTEEAATFMSSAYKAIDKAAKTGVVKKNTADRKKSRLAKYVRKNVKS